jgi:hypothetical protein
MALTWISQDERLHHAGRFFRDGDNIPAGILSDARLSQFIAEGKIKNDAKPVKIADPEITENVNKRGRKPKQEEPSEFDIANDDGDLK